MDVTSHAKKFRALAMGYRGPATNQGPLTATNLAALGYRPNFRREVLFRNGLLEKREPTEPGMRKLKSWAEGLRRDVVAVLWEAGEVTKVPVEAIRTALEMRCEGLPEILAELSDKSSARVLSRRAKEMLHFVHSRSPEHVRAHLPNLTQQFLNEVVFVIRQSIGYASAQEDGNAGLEQRRIFNWHLHERISLRKGLREAAYHEEAFDAALALCQAHEDLLLGPNANIIERTFRPPQSRYEDEFKVSLPKAAAKLYFAELNGWLERISEATTELNATVSDGRSGIEQHKATLKKLHDTYHGFNLHLRDQSVLLQNTHAGESNWMGEFADLAQAFAKSELAERRLTDRRVQEIARLFEKILTLTVEWERFNCPDAYLLSRDAIGQERKTTAPPEKPFSSELEAFKTIKRASVGPYISTTLRPDDPWFEWKAALLKVGILPTRDTKQLSLWGWIKGDFFAGTRLNVLQSALEKVAAEFQRRNEHYLLDEDPICIKMHSRESSKPVRERVNEEIAALERAVKIDPAKPDSRLGLVVPATIEEIRKDVEEHYATILEAYDGATLQCACTVCDRPEHFPKAGLDIHRVLKERGIVTEKDFLYYVPIMAELPRARFLHKSHGESGYHLVQALLDAYVHADLPCPGRLICCGYCRKEPFENPAWQAFKNKGWIEVENYDLITYEDPTSDQVFKNRIVYRIFSAGDLIPECR